MIEVHEAHKLNINNLMGHAHFVTQPDRHVQLTSISNTNIEIMLLLVHKKHTDH